MQTMIKRIIFQTLDADDDKKKLSFRCWMQMMIKELSFRQFMPMMIKRIIFQILNADDDKKLSFRYWMQMMNIIIS